MRWPREAGKVFRRALAQSTSSWSRQRESPCRTTRWRRRRWAELAHTPRRPGDAAQAAPVPVATTKTSPPSPSTASRTTCARSPCRARSTARGFNGNGEVGQVTGNAIETPTQVGAMLYSSVGVGEYVSCGVTAAGVAYCWGFGNTGALGNSVFSSSATPVQVSTPRRSRPVAASFGGRWWHGARVAAGGGRRRSRNGRSELQLEARDGEEVVQDDDLFTGRALRAGSRAPGHACSRRHIASWPPSSSCPRASTTASCV